MPEHNKTHSARPSPNAAVAWALIDKLREGIVQLDAQGRIELINKAACELFGGDGNALYGQAWEAVCDHCMSNGRRYAPGQSPIRQALSDNRERRIEGDRFVGLDGISRVVSYDCLPVADDQASGMVISFVDVTADLLTEQLHTWEASILTLMSGGARLSALIEAILNGLDVLTPGGQSALVLSDSSSQPGKAIFTVSLTARACDDLLRESTELSGKSSGDVWPVRDDAGRLLAKLYCPGFSQLEDGQRERRVLERAVSLVRLALEQDQVHRTREDSDRRFQQLAEQVSEVFWLTQRDGTLLYVSPAFERIWGVPVATLYQQPWVWVDCVVADDRDRVIKAQALQSGGHYQLEYRISRPDGGIRWIEDLAFPVKDDAGQVIRIVGTARDITARKSAEQRIDGLLSDLRRSNDELQSFAAIVSHDLQEPLRKIQMFSERLQRDTEHLGTQQIHFLVRMQQAAVRMRNLIQALLRYAQLSAIDEPQQPVDLDRLLDEVLADLELRLNEAGARIVRKPLPQIQGYSSQWRQVLLNLLGNALKFRRPAVALEVAIHTEISNDNHLQLIVADNGLGFDVTKNPNLFKPFYRVGQSPDVEGTGIGLAIVEKIVHQHGLTIRVESTPNRGSRFIIEWPEDAGKPMGTRHWTVP
ncbi:ATP-binding protein [Saccharospirillum alexandrii]|uniref:ATP-binding protein n=1 Tax=Saccharospirillum alexandrii TaxID=2448477 RepID=UPI0037350FFB